MFWHQRPILITAGSQTETLKPGDAAVLKGWHSVWSEHHLKNSELEPWRAQSDDLADHALAALELLPSNATCPSSAPFELIKHHLCVTSPSEQHPHIRAFWDEVSRLPPSLAVDADSKLEGIELERALEREREMVVQGQEVYVKYAGPIAIALLYFSLAGGFSSPRISRVLELTSYLLPPRQLCHPTPPSPSAASPSSPPSASASTSRTFERLSETGQWITDCMDGPAAIEPPADPLAPIAEGFASQPGRAWADTVRVRLLHAQMRARVLKAARRRADADVEERQPGRKMQYKVAEDGVPLNVEDMAATLASFAVAPLWCLRTIGFRLPPAALASYLNLWRHLGFYLGVPVPVLRAHFGTWDRADAFLQSVAAHLFVAPTSEEERHRLPTLSVLRAAAERGGPAADPAALEYHHALARALLCDAFADDLGIPRVGWRARLKVRASFWAMWVPVRFGEVYPRKGWEEKRRECIRRALPRIVCRSLGGRRTRFFAGGLSGEGQMKNGTVGAGSREEGEKKGGWKWDKWEVVDVEGEEWVAEGREIMQMWREVWREMFAVVGVGALVVGAAAWTSFSRWR